jgi:hypothetical protein
LGGAGGDISLLSSGTKTGMPSSFLNHPNHQGVGEEESWIDEQGNVVLYDDYDGERPFLSEELDLINDFTAAGQF